MTQEEQIYAINGMSESSMLESQDVVRDPNTQRIVKQNGFPASDLDLNVTFTIEPQYSKLQTYMNNTPTYVDVEYITILVPGQPVQARTTVHEPVTEYYRWRFPIEYERFKKGMTEQIAGTPLAAWSAISPAFVKHLESTGIKTVEQLAALSDSAAPSVPGFHTWKAKAQEFVRITKDSTAANALQAKFDTERETNEAKAAALQAQIDKLVQMLEEKKEGEVKLEKGTKAK